jgi:hypothetical protein
MKQEDIDKAFENRFRIKSESHHVAWVKGVKDLCRDFFEAGICLGEGEHCPPIPMSAIVKAAGDVAFEDWWSLYDKKCGRKDCEKKWSRLSLEEKEACLAATPAYVASTPDKQFRKNPLSYLNQKAWNDEIIVKNGTDKPTIEEQRISRLASILTD